jgi:DNA-binding response OmpR family regulator
MARVLIVDDDELFIKLMVHALKQRGHDVEFAMDGLAGSRKFEAGHYDVVVCDIVMPEQEGVETIKIMRRARPDVGIVAISGGLSLSHTTNIDVLHIAGQFGANMTLRKPFQLSELTAAVDAVLASQQTARTQARA